ncbi:MULTISPECIES: 1,2-phenylacetyl-CoA epoxidase subunit PaaC [unclassified Variovorax]|uniref:1,2-phenylacetyl-CoA epoxidase subunit PaaC n=1 Tax=unclassified Variovorax TaxID=663243 RepID=UPI001BD408B8|nr:MULTISPECIES: 1,2-phenylacetyl-CoA epoxidase subunit PaaC [unclassified Variovorax]
MNTKLEYLLRMGDNCLVLSQQLAAWCGHGPALEEDLALTNVALDLLGQARMWLTLAGEEEGLGRDEDALAYFRDGNEFRNLLLVEQPNGHYGNTVARQFLFDAWHMHALAGLAGSSDARIAEIAQKSVKEVRYHFERSAGLMIALGRGTPESHARMQAAVELLWPYANEWFESDAVDEACAAAGVAPAAPSLAAPWRASVEAVLSRATLAMPGYIGHQRGGKRGVHTEHLGHLLTDLQFVQRTYPGAQW